MVGYFGKIILTVLAFIFWSNEVCSFSRLALPQKPESAPPNRGLKFNKRDPFYMSFGLSGWKNNVFVNSQDLSSNKWEYLNASEHFDRDGDVTVLSAFLSLELDFLIKPIWSSRKRAGIYLGPRVALNLREYRPGGASGFLFVADEPRILFAYGLGFGVMNRVSDTKVSFLNMNDNSLTTMELSYRRIRFYTDGREIFLKRICFKLGLSYGNYGGSISSFYITPGIGLVI